MDDKPKKINKLRATLGAKLAGAALLMTSGIGLGHSSQETREYVKREPIFRESTNGSGNPPERLGSISGNYNIGPQEYMSTPFLTSAHAEKIGDRIKVQVFDADDREINCYI